MGFKLIQDIHDQADTNDSGIREFEDYLDISSQNYENFKPINQFHNEYEQFPTVYYENTLEEPKEEKEKKDRRDSSSSDKSSSSSSGSSSASGSSEGASSSSGPTGAESSVGAASGASSSAALANASASQILSTTFVAMVAVTAVVVPIIENADLEVDLDVQYDAGILTYMIELVNASEGSDYYAVVMEGQTVILQQQIFDNYQSNTITDLRNSQEHRVEVRTGTPPLLVVASEVIPATPSWAEWGHLTVDYNSIDYGVYFHGDSGEAVLKLTDPNSGETLYTKEMVDGLNSDVIGGLFSSHLYTLTVETETDVLLFKDIQTEYRDVSWNHLTVIDNVIDYGVEVNLGDVEVTISLYDPSTSSVIYSMDLTPGYNADVIRDLEYNHTYELTVASVDETFLFETVITDSEPITVTVGHLTPKDNTIDYELIVSGEGKTVTLDLYDAAGGPSLYTATLTSGSNTGIIEGLSYNHSYLLTVSSASKTYLSESVTTETEPTKVTLDSLTSTETTVEYKVTVTGNRDVATVYLKDPTSGETLYTKELTVGINTAVIENLEAGHTYQFTVSSKTETYVSREITTGSKPTEVTLNQLTTSDNTIDYEATVTGNSEVVTAYLYDADGEEVYSKELSEGTNSDTIKDLEYDSVYRFTISSETQIYVSEDVTISASITVESLAADGLIINYKMTVNGTEAATIILYREEGDLEIESAPLPAGKTTEGTFRGTADLPIEPNKVYYVKGYIDGKEYNLGSVTPESKIITEKLSPDGDYIFFTIEVIKSAGSEMDLYVYNSKGELLDKYSQKYPINRDPETVEGAIIHIPWGDTYTLKAEIDGQTYAVGEVDVVDEPSFTANGNTIVYSFTVDDKALLTSVHFDSVDGGSVTLSLGQSEDGKFSGAVTKILIRETDYFVFKWDTEYKVQITSGGVFYEGKVTTDPFDATISNASATGNVVQATVTFGMTNFDDIEVALYTDSACKQQVAGSVMTPTGSTLTYECSDLEPGKKYYIGVMYNNERMVYSEVKAASDIVFEAVEGLTYADVGKALISKTSGNTEQKPMYSTDGSTWIESIPTVTAAGVFTVYYKAAASTNYEALSAVEVSVTVDKVDQEPSASKVEFTDEETASIKVLNLKEDPTITYEVKSGESVTVDRSTGVLTWVKVGESVVTASFSETDNYNAGSIDVTVNAKSSAADIQTSVVSNTVIAEITFKHTITSDAVVGIYSDEECTEVIEEAQKQYVKQSMIYFSNKIPDSGLVYLGARDGNGNLASVPVSKSTTDQFCLDSYGLNIHYKINQGSITYRGITIWEDDTVITSLPLYEGDYGEWTFGHKYKLSLTIDLDSSTSYEATVMELDLTNTAHDVSYDFKNHTVTVNATIDYPMAMYICRNGAIVETKYIEPTDTKFTNGGVFYYDETNEFFVHKRSLTTYSSVSDGNAVIHGIDNLPFADIVVPSEIVFKQYSNIDAPLYYQWKDGEKVTFGLYNDAQCSSAIEIVTATSGSYKVFYTYYFTDNDRGHTYYLGIKYNDEVMKVAELKIPAQG